MSGLPTGVPTEFEIARCEVKKTLPAKDGQKPATILKLGLIAPDGSKGYAEMFVRDGQAPPGEGQKHTLILDPPKQEGWLPTAKRPRSGASGARGGGRQKTPEEIAAERASIEAQVCLKAAVEVLAGQGTPSPAEIVTTAEDAARALKAAKEILR